MGQHALKPLFSSFSFKSLVSNKNFLFGVWCFRQRNSVGCPFQCIARLIECEHTAFSVRFSALDSKSGQKASHTHLIGGIELPKSVLDISKDSNLYKAKEDCINRRNK